MELEYYTNSHPALWFIAGLSVYMKDMSETQTFNWHRCLCSINDLCYIVMLLWVWPSGKVNFVVAGASDGKI